MCHNLDPKCPSGVAMPPGTDCCSTGLPKGCCANAANYDILTDLSFDSSGPYDINSIMHYRRDGFAIPGTDTLVPVESGLVIPEFNPPNPDAIDFDRVCKIYASKCPKRQACRSLGCPTHCTIIPQCHNIHFCDSKPDAPCSDPTEANDECRRQRDICIKNGCNLG